jgi:hypothetical protein
MITTKNQVFENIRNWLSNNLLMQIYLQQKSAGVPTKNQIGLQHFKISQGKQLFASS